MTDGALAGVLEEYDNKSFTYINKGYYIGEVELLTNKFKREFSVMATEDSEVLVLRKKDFKDLMKTFKKEMEEFKEQAYKRQGNL